MIVIDSSVWIAEFRNETTPSTVFLRSIEREDTIIVLDLVMFELLQGARDNAHANRIERNLRKFEIASAAGPDLVVRAASNHRHLRSRGITIRKSIDVIIATFCIENDHLLLHQDRDFQPFAEHLGLRIAG